MTTSTLASAPSRSAQLARISAVAQTMGACGLTAASPVIMPTRSAPKASQSAKNFSLTSAFSGAVYILRRPATRAAKWAPAATSDFPDPVGVLMMTLRPSRISSSASSWAG